MGVSRYCRNFLFCFFLLLMTVLWLLSRKNKFGRLSGYFCSSLLNLEVPVLCLFVIQTLRFFVLKIAFFNLFFFCYHCLFLCLSF